MILSAHQSQFLPWPPYFRKVALSDVFVWMDDVQFQRGQSSCVQNRNQVWSPQGALWITLPVKKSELDTTIREVELVDSGLSKKAWKSIEIYRKARAWNVHGEALYHLLCEQHYASLDEVNFAFFSYVLTYLDVKTRILRLSSLKLSSQKSDLVLNMCQAVGADVYLSGCGAKDYLNEFKFSENGVMIRYLESKPPIYSQFKSPQLIGLSMLDMIMNQSLDEICKYLMEPMV